MEKTCYALRLSARAIDLMLVGLIVLIFEKLLDGFSANIILAFLLYNMVVALVDGKSLGKYLFSLNIQTKRTGFSACLARSVREPLLLLLIPLVFLNFLSISPLPLHDRISGTKVIRDEI